MLPGDDNDIDFELEEHIGSQVLDEQEHEEQQTTTDTCTQNTLDAASVLVAGFGNGNNNDRVSAARSNRPCPSFVRRNHHDDSDDEVDEEEDEQEEDEEQEELPLKDQLAQQLCKDGLDLPSEERQFISECEEGGASGKCIKNKECLLLRCLDAIRACGGPISRLAKNKVPNTHHPSQESPLDYELFDVCGSNKDSSKHKILNNVFTLCGMKWDCRSGRNKGEALAPTSFNKMMQQLSHVFQSKGSQCEHNKDFNDKGEFHGVIRKRWEEIRKDRPTFGTSENKARVEHALFRKFVQAIRDKNMRPCEDPEHLLICVTFILGFCCGLQGSSEHIDLSAEDFCIGEHTIEDGEELAGLKWFGVKAPWSKTNQSNLKNTLLPRDKDAALAAVEDPQHDCWDTWKMIIFYPSRAHPKAKKFCGRLAKQGEKCEGGKLKKAFGHEVWFAESGFTTATNNRSNWNLGPTKHRELCKETARLAGVERWEQCTGHALRALCITHCIGSNMRAAEAATKVRHSSVNSQKTHAMESNKHKANRMAAMNPSGKLASKPNVSNKKLKSDCQELSDDVVALETHPMLAQNHQKLAHMATKRAPVPQEEKENVMVNESDDDVERKMERLRRKNEMLRPEQENQRLRMPLQPAHHGPPPPAQRMSCPPMHPPRHSDHHGPSPPHSGNCYNRMTPTPPPHHHPGCDNRRSCPPTHNPHPSCHSRERCEDMPLADEFGGHHGGCGDDCHRRH